MGRFGRTMLLPTRARWAIVVAWVAAAAALTLWLPSIEEAQVGALGDLVPADSEAVETEERARELFGLPLLSRTLVVVRDEDGVDPERRADALRFLSGLSREASPPFEAVLAAVPISNSGALLQANETGTALLTYLFISPSVGQSEQAGIASAVADRLEEEIPGSAARVTGAVSARAERGELIREHLPLVEALTVLVVAALAGFAFRSAVVPAVGLAAVAIAYLVSVRLLSKIGQSAEVSVPSEVEPVIVALIFGLVTDYVVFQAAAFRHHLQGRRDPGSAILRATREIVPVILAAGSMVAGAAFALIFADVGFLRAFGPGVAISVLIALAVSVTFVPAAFGLLGSRLFWPRGGEEGGRSRSRLVRLAASRPLLVAGATAMVLAAGAIGVFQMRTGNDLYGALPASSESRQGFEAAADAFAGGIVGPTTVLVEGQGLPGDAVRRLSALLERQRGVAGVIGPGDLSPVGGFEVFRTDDAARYIVVLRDPPLSAAAIRTLGRIRTAAPRLLSAAGMPGARASFGGDTAVSSEVVTGTGSSLIAVAPIALLVVYALLAVLLRRWLAPLPVMIAGILSVAAALGLTVIFFQDVLNQAELTFFVPFAGAVLLFALGCDYSALIAKRIYDESGRRGFDEAVVIGGGTAARAISTAGVILALSFAALALIPIRSFDQFAFAMGVGLLLDTFVVRPLLIPALIMLAHRRRSR